MCCSECRYLERTLPSKDRERFHFFNSFFFRKLLENNSASTCKVDYEQVRKWSGAANLFEKDYIFIPVLRRWQYSRSLACIECWLQILRIRDFSSLYDGGF